MGHSHTHRVDAASVLLIFLQFICGITPVARGDNPPPDEAKQRGIPVAYFVPTTQAVQDYFQGMDTVSLPTGPLDEALPDQLLDLAGAGGRPKRTVAPADLNKSEQLGRNTWMIWCGGNERFWDWLSSNSHGFLDFVKLIDSRKRATRWRDAGMVNEPEMVSATKPDRFGLWFDQPADPAVRELRDRYIKECFEEFEKNQGYKRYDANTPHPDYYNPKFPPPQVYGLSSGVIGLRLFPNPNFYGSARKRWDSKRFTNDRDYWNDPRLVRPFRVGMSCAFCHANPHPLNPPADPANPRWENLSGNIGSQYLRIRAIFGNLLTPDNFVYHVLDSQPPGTIDTSLVATDYINNPNTMNAIFGVPQRVVRSFSNPKEKLDKPAAAMPSIWKDPVGEAPPAYKKQIPQLAQSNDNPRWVPRILFDGADSIGAWGALARVYLNIGTYSEQWTRLHEPLLGFLPPEAAHGDKRIIQLPFRIEDCRNNSVYWLATQERVAALRDYFLKITPTMPLLDVVQKSPTEIRPSIYTDAFAWKSPEERRASINIGLLARGRKVFARNCIVCHSSIQPETDPRAFLPDKEQGKYAEDYREISDARKAQIAREESMNPDGSSNSWDHDPGQWLENPKYRKWAECVVENKGFWKFNFLSSDFRVPVNYVGTNSGRAMATNGTTGHMWEDFTSESYRKLPSVGAIPFYNPFTGLDDFYLPRHKVNDGPRRGGGPGYYRPASLMSVWATAPLLHNNSVGLFNNDPSLNGRLAAFDDAIHKFLWPARRLENSAYNNATPQRLQRDHGLIWRTPGPTMLQIRAKDVPFYLRRLPLPRIVFEWSESVSNWMGVARIVPTLVLLAIAFLFFVSARGRSWSSYFKRTAGFVSIIGGLLFAFFVYLSTGGFGDLNIGPIPAGTPVNLLANINPEASKGDMKKAIHETIQVFAEIEARKLEGSDRDRLLTERVAPMLMKVSKCPDFVMDKGHYFPWFNQMTDADKEALIELLKTF